LTFEDCQAVLHLSTNFPIPILLLLHHRSESNLLMSSHQASQKQLSLHGLLSLTLHFLTIFPGCVDPLYPLTMEPTLAELVSVFTFV
jgi:hypothetical protein